MDDAALVFVRDDGAAAERLAVALERAGVSICRSASVFEDPQAYGAIVALFSPAAVRSRLVMDAALRAREEGRLVAVFVGLCPLPQAFSGIAMHDLSSWGGNADDAVVTAVAQQIRRARAVRTNKATLERGMGGARAYDMEPQGLQTPDYYAAPDAFHLEQRPDFGGGFAGPAMGHGVTFDPPQVRHNGYGYDEPRPAFTAYAPEPDPQAYGHANPNAPYMQAQTPRRFAGLTAADTFDAPSLHAPYPQAPAPQAPSRAWADEWVAQELRQRGGAAPTIQATANTAPLNPAAVNRAAYRDFGGYGAGFPVVQTPAGNTYDAPVPPAPRPPEPRPNTRLPAVDPLLPARDDRLGYERPPGAQDPYGVSTAPQDRSAQDREAQSRPGRRRRSDSLFAVLIAVGLAGVGATAFLAGGGFVNQKATLVSAPVEFVEPAAAQPDSPAAPERVNVHSVSLNDALGDAEKAKREPAKGPATDADRGWERRRR